MKIDEKGEQFLKTDDILSFGPFRLCLTERKLLRDGVTLRLTPTQYAVLELLTRNAGQLVSKEEFAATVWKEKSVVSNNLPQVISRLRKQMGTDAQDYIRAGLGGYILAAVVTAEGGQKTAAPARSRIWLVAGVGAAALVTLFFIWAVSTIQPPKVSFQQLTDDGLRKDGPLFIDRGDVYFAEIAGENEIIARTSTTHGAVERMNLAPLVPSRILDQSPSGSEFLIQALNPDKTFSVWRWTAGRPAHPLLSTIDGREGVCWISDSEVAAVSSNRLRILNVTKPHASPKSIPFQEINGTIPFARWSQTKNTLRFAVQDPAGEKASIWEIRGLYGKPARLATFPPNSRYGAWSRDGSMFAFSAKGEAGTDVWVEREAHGFWRPAGVGLERLTSGPMDFQWATPTPDGSGIVAIGTSEHAELVRYDSAAGQFVRYLGDVNNSGGLNALELDFSRDSSRIAYSTWPERALWVMNADGSKRIRLTAPPLESVQPHWSPDGTQIAFMGRYPGKPWQVYIVPSAGGTALTPAPAAEDEGVPTWSPDGARIVFGDFHSPKQNEKATVHILDLRQHRVSVIAGSTAIFTPRWSPAGRYILGVTYDYEKLLLFDCQSGTWQELVNAAEIEDPVWSADSKYIYFRTNGARSMPFRSAGDPNIAGRNIFRIDVHSRTLERLANLHDFQWPKMRWTGITPDGTPLALRGVVVQELFLLSLRP